MVHACIQMNSTTAIVALDFMNKTVIFQRPSGEERAIAQFAITINSNVCPHIRVPNTLMKESYADVIGIFNSEACY